VSAAQESPVKLVLALARLRTMPPGGLGRMKAAALERFEHAALDVAFAVMAEHKRREETPRGKAKLRLVAKDGELTEAGLRSARAKRAARTRRHNRSA
jgi:hypothetical protein